MGGMQTKIHNTEASNQTQATVPSTGLRGASGFVFPLGEQNDALAWTATMGPGPPMPLVVATPHTPVKAYKAVELYSRQNVQNRPGAKDHLSTWFRFTNWNKIHYLQMQMAFNVPDWVIWLNVGGFVVVGGALFYVYVL